MPVSVTMPPLGESVSEGTVTRWLKKEGDHVDTDEPLLEVSTEKVDTEIPSPASGVLRNISVSEDETVEVGTEIASIASTDEEPSAGGAATGPETGAAREAGPHEPAGPGRQATPAGQPAAPGPSEPEPVGTAGQPAPPSPATGQPPPTAQGPPPAEGPPPAAGPAAVQGPATAQEPGAGTPYVTPLVRKLAAEYNVDLSTVEGTGVGGRIRKQDVLEAAHTRQAQQPQQAQPAEQAEQPQRVQPAEQVEQEAPAGPPRAPETPPTAEAPQPPTGEEAGELRGRTLKMSRIRSVIARRMLESLNTSAQLTTVVEVDVTRIARLRERAKADFEARQGASLTFLPFFAQATTEALKTHPKLNASIDTDAGEVTYFDAEHLSIAVDTERGLLAPVIHDAGDFNLGGLARKIADLADRTRRAQVSPEELSGGTFTLTNTGSRGAVMDTPIINQPQVGILSTCKAVKRPVVVEDPEWGEVFAARSLANFALTYDHRLVDGADAVRFLNTIKARLEEGAFEAELGLG